MGQAAWVDIANSALIKIGTATITALTQQVVAARLCNARLPLVVPLILRRFPWKSAMKTVTLSALSTPPPDTRWGFAYQLPTDIVRIWKLEGVDFGHGFVIRQNQLWTNTGVTTVVNDDGSLSSTGIAPVLTYVANPYTVTPSFLDPSLIEAIACQLAVDCCYQLTQSLPLKQSLQGEAKTSLQSAKSIDSMETPEVFSWEASEFLMSRFAGTNYLGPDSPGYGL
jgi:hypothetical protein